MPDKLTTAITDFETLHTPVAIFELDGTFVAINRASEALLGRAAAEVVGHKTWEFAPGVEHIWDEMVAAARVRGTSRGTITLATPHEHRQIHYINTLRSYEGKTYVLSYAFELPSGDAALEARHRAEALGLVAGGIAHDFNNQLVSVLAEAGIARENPSIDDETREAFRRIEAAAHRMAQLTRQLLAYAGRGRFVSEMLDPDGLVEDMREPLARLMRPDATLQITTSANRVALEADRTLLCQVIQNLVVNASEALGDGGGSIIVTTSHSGGSWFFEVSDSGIGMDRHTVARIFDPFFTTKRDRHGLGLSAAQGIVRRLGGDISADSTPGGGSTLRVSLPVVPGAQPVRRRTPTELVPVSTLRDVRVLVADDEPGVLSTVKRLLERRGAQVVIASDGAQARVRLAQGIYQIVLFDVMMPELTGYQLLPLARDLQPSAKVMLMSGYTEHARGHGDEPDAFLEKPFTAKALDAAIDALIVPPR
ncbi:MAG TPA: ATP-binding protein [Kofleriaceae bacterium]|nr:ATP-binding protein [Kofleriaceae bacterium]